MDFILDTNILVYFVRDDGYIRQVEEKFPLFLPGNFAFISIVSAGEIRALAYKFSWGDSKRKRLEKLLHALNPVPIESPDITLAYADIDAFSQGDHPHIIAPAEMTARNMGKNDLWIAATAHLFGATLLTTDADFNHLSPQFFRVENVVFSPITLV